MLSHLVTYLSDPVRIIDDLGLKESHQDQQLYTSHKASDLAERLSATTLQTDDIILVRDLIDRVTLDVDAKGYVLNINPTRLAKVLNLELEIQQPSISIQADIELATCNNGKKVIISNQPNQKPAPNPALISAVLSAHQIKEKYMRSDGSSLSKIASEMNMDARQVWRTLKLAYLSPDIQLAILSGMQPKGLRLKDLIYQSIPTSWAKQRRLLGFA